jgi:hypothetical protein
MDKGVGKHQKVSQCAFKTEIRVTMGCAWQGIAGGMVAGTELKVLRKSAQKRKL